MAADAATTIYVRLLDEGTDVWRPVQAEPVGNKSYRILSAPPDSEDERWEFCSGDVVRCEKKSGDRGDTPSPYLVAVSRAQAAVQPQRPAESDGHRDDRE